MFILEHAFQHQIFFSPRMHMGGKPAVRGVTHDGCRARHLIAQPVEHAPLDAGHWRGNPVKCGTMHDGAPRKIRIQVHGSSAYLSSGISSAPATGGHAETRREVFNRSEAVVWLYKPHAS